MLGWKDFVKMSAPYMPPYRPMAEGLNTFVDQEGASLPKYFKGGIDQAPITRGGVTREYQWSKDRDEFKRVFGYDPVERNRREALSALVYMHPLTLSAGAMIPSAVGSRYATALAAGMGGAMGVSEGVQTGSVSKGIGTGLESMANTAILLGSPLKVSIGTGAAGGLVDTLANGGSAGESISQAGQNALANYIADRAWGWARKGWRAFGPKLGF